MRLDFHTNFNREGGEMNYANEYGLPAIEVRTGLNRMFLRCFVFILFF